MKLQTILLRFMLASLAATALLGAYLVLFHPDESAIRAMVTALATTAASGAMVGLTRLVDRPWSRPAGVFGVGVVVVEYLLILGLIWWENAAGSLPFDVRRSLWLTIGWVLCGSLPAAGFLLLRARLDRRRLADVGLVLCGIFFLQLMIGTWKEYPDSTRLGDERWIDAGWFTALFGATLLACLPRLRDRLWPGLGVLASLIAWAAGTYGSFQEPVSEITETVLTIGGMLAALTAYLNLFAFLSLEGGWKWLRPVAFAFTTLAALGFAALVVRNIWTDADFEPEWLARATAASAIVAGCATVAMTVLLAIARYGEGREEVRDAPFREIALTCPRCGSEETLPVGNSVCSRCALEFSIHLN